MEPVEVTLTANLILSATTAFAEIRPAHQAQIVYAVEHQPQLLEAHPPHPLRHFPSQGLIGPQSLEQDLEYL
jgi:hypothetical protein